MDWICNMLETNNEVLILTNDSMANMSVYSNLSLLTLKKESTDWNIKEIVLWFIIPGFCIIGILGHGLTVTVLTVRFWNGIELLEMCPNIGLFCLAVVEFLFCVVTIAGSFTNDTKMVFTPGDFSLYFMIYGHYFQNVCIKSSTTIIVIMSVYRYLAVSKPIFTKIHIETKFIMMAIFLGCTFWILYLLPLLWTWNIAEIRCLRKSYMVLDVGIFESNEIFRQTMTYSWFVLGVAIPVLLLFYCNFAIMFSIYKSKRKNKKLKRPLTRLQKTRWKKHKKELRLSVMLIIIIFTYFVCTLPGEIFQFYQEIVRKSGTSSSTHRGLIILCNLLQAIDMSCNFILYYLLNSQFKVTLVSIFCSSLSNVT